MSKDRYAISSLNPHTHAGCDNRYKCNYTRRRVSIHTPTQGVTKLRLLCFGSSWFQSTHPRRVWPSYKIVVVRPFLFQSTHPRRVWQDARWCYTHFLEFQSTHPRRVWLTLIGEDFNQSTFQSTHPRRVWPNLATEISKADMFQSTHPRRVWPYKIIQRCKWNSFNPHTHAGCDILRLKQWSA